MSAIGRRTFLGAVATGAAMAALAHEAKVFAAGPMDSTRERPWVLQVREIPITGRGGVWDLRSGENVSRRVPYALAPRLERSRLTGHPVRVSLFRLDAAGKHYAIGNRIASEPAWVRVVGP